MILCTVCYSVAMLLASFTASTFELLMFFHFLIGLGDAFFFVPATYIVMRAFSKEKRGKALGLYFIAPATAMMVVPVFSAPFIEIFGWRPLYWLLAIPSIIIAAMFQLFLKEPVLDEEKQLPSNYKKYLLPKPLNLDIIKIIVILFLSFQATGLISLIPIYIVNRYFVSLTIAGLILAVLQFGAISGGPIGGALSDRFGRRKTMLTMLLVSSMIYFLQVPGIFFLLFLIVFSNISRTSIIPIFQAYIADVTPQKELGIVLGFVNTANFLGVSTASIVIGTITDNVGFAFAFLFVAIGYLAAFSLAFTLKKQ